MGKTNLSKHDRYLRELSAKIKHKYDFLICNVPIKKSKRKIGEIDIIGRKGDKFDIYEVKCSYRIIKAKKQLSRIKNILDIEGGNSFFYCGSAGMLISI